jgi:two-component system, OmpR family, response regulator
MPFSTQSPAALRHILVVEDDPDIQMIARVSLEAVGGYRVTICSSGEEALRVAPSCAADLIMLDVMMPGLDGPSTLAQLREIASLRDTPTIFMTACTQPGEIADYLALGALSVIAKPFSPLQLPKEVARIWSEYGSAHRS